MSATATKPAPAKAANSDTPEERKINKCDPAGVKKDHIMAFLYYGKVTQASKSGSDHILNVEGLDNAQGSFQVRGNSLIENSLSADLYAETTKVTKTKAAEILVSSHNRPFTVVFEKSDGTERTLRGRLIAPEPLLGRSHVEDLEEPEGKRMRLVDHRTLKSITVDGVKYVVGK